MPTEPNVFLAMPDACGRRPSDSTHLKNGLVLYLSGGGTDDKYRSESSHSGIQDMIECQDIICYVVLSYDKLVILTLRVESHLYTGMYQIWRRRT